MPEFIRFDAGAANFPPPQVPVLPPPLLRDLGGQGTGFPMPSDLSYRRFWHYQRGRYALRDAYLLAGVGAAGGLLAPAYHCRTMLDPALSLGATALLYPLNPDLSPNLDGLQRLLAQKGNDGRGIRALLVTHYFGMPQKLDSVLDLCRRHRVELIEDCSHALVLDPECNASPAMDGGIAISARLGVSSPYKFLACPDGGLLWVDQALGVLPHPPHPAGLADETRAALRFLRDLLKPSRSGALPEAAATDLPPESVTNLRYQDDQPSADFDPSRQHLQSLAVSRKLARHAQISRICYERRRRFTQWMEAVADIPGCRALVPQIGNDTVPYMFPLLLDTVEPAFQLLKRSGLPIWRWDQMAVSNCAVAMEYRLRLLHLPCHQGLIDDQMEWMTRTLRSVLKNCVQGADRR